jgi:hypothetical protein
VTARTSGLQVFDAKGASFMNGKDPQIGKPYGVETGPTATSLSSMADRLH